MLADHVAVAGLLDDAFSSGITLRRHLFARHRELRLGGERGEREGRLGCRVGAEPRVLVKPAVGSNEGPQAPLGERRAREALGD